MGHASEGANSWKSSEGERLAGKIMPSKKELEDIREKAKLAGEDPDKTERMYLEKFDEANARLREADSEQARKLLERDLNKS